MILMLVQTLALTARLMRMTAMLQRQHSNKLANLEAVVGSIAHEVRQPLAAIAVRGAAAQRYLSCTPPRLSEAVSSVGTMVESSMRASEVFDSIRALF